MTPTIKDALAVPGIGDAFNLLAEMVMELAAAKQALEKIATGNIPGQRRDSIDAANIMRSIASDALTEMKSWHGYMERRP